MTLTNTSCMLEGIHSRLKWSNVRYHSVQNLLPSVCSPWIERLNYSEAQFCLFFYTGVKSVYQIRRGTLAEGVVDGVLSEVSVAKRDEVQGSGEDCIIRSFAICTVHHILFGWCVQDMCHLWGRVFVGRAKGKRQLGRPSIEWRIILKLILKKSFGRVWTGLTRFGTGTRGGLLRTRRWTVCFCVLTTFSNRTLLLGLSWLVRWFVRSETMTHIRNARTHASRSSAACLLKY